MSVPTIVSEAKGIHQLLKELLKNKEPFDKEVDFQRKTLRRRYLQLLLVHPNAKESKDAQHHLWMQTSYAFIASYKKRISELDRAIQQNQRPQQSGQQPQGRQNNHGVVEHRKLVQRFRQFLADEEKFWTQLVLRLRRLFDLTEAQPALIALGLLTDADDIQSHTVEASETRDGVMHVANGRNHFQFPPEEPGVSYAPATAEERESRLAILSKALTCLGDIARYRELYNESNGRRAGHEDGPPRRGRNRRGGAVDMPPRPRNYDKARQCYEQARLLVPYEGNPSHQLAILSSYQKDSFASLIHYYRALCVSQPYETAAENLGTVLSKALDQWRQKSKKEKHDKDKNGPTDLQLPPRVRVDNFKEKVVVLHALWRVGMEKGIEKMKSIAPKHNEKVFNDFYALVSERHLPIDMISNTIVLSQGALWKHRMVREKTDAAPVQPGTSTIIEWGLLDHIMDMHLVLLEVGKEEMKDPPTMDGVDDIAQRISAVFRRTLPALRIASKWLRANFKYVMSDQEFAALQVKESARGSELNKQTAHKISGYSVKTVRFWKTYAQFILALSQAFPINKLTPLNAPLEEDIEMKSFSPLKKLMDEDRDPGKGKSPMNSGEPREHPNVEQLMRIYDLLEDAKTLTKMENSPLVLINNHIVYNPDAEEDVRALTLPEVSTAEYTAQQIWNEIRDNFPQRNLDPDEQTEVTSQTDDDLIRCAVEHVVNGGIVDDDDADEEIVWNPRAAVSPLLSPNIYPTPLTPNKPLLSPKTISPRSPTHSQHVRQQSFNPQISRTSAPVTTAQDLLKDVMSGFSVGTKNLAPPAPQPKLLFMSENSHRPNHSIWSASPHEQLYSGNQNVSSTQIYQTQTSPRQYPNLPPSQDLSQQSIWSPSYPTQSPNSQHNLVGALPSASFAPPPHMNLSVGTIGQRPPQHHQQHQQQYHQRIPSATAQFMPLHQPQQDPFTYSSPAAQQPIHRPEHLLSSSMSGPKLSQGGFGGAPTDTYNMGHYHSAASVGPQSYLSPMSQIWGNSG